MTGDQTIHVSTDLPLAQYAHLYRIASSLPGNVTVGALVAELVNRGLNGRGKTDRPAPAPTPDEQRDTRMRQLIEAGWTKPKIAAELHVSVEQVAKVRKAMGYGKVGRPARQPKTNVGPYTERKSA